MLYQLLAPLQTDFSIVSERPLRDPKGYSEFWDEIQSERAAILEELRESVPEEIDLPSDPQIRFAHASTYGNRPFNRYQSLESDSLERPLHVFELGLDGPNFAASAAASIDYVALERRRSKQVGQIVRGLSKQVVGIICRIFDHGISLLEVEVDLEGYFQFQDVPAELDNLQRAGIDLGEHLADHVANELLTPAFNWLRNREHGSIFEPGAPAGSTMPHGEVLWITRTLIFERDDIAAHDEQKRREIINHWLKHSGGSEREGGRTLIDHLIDDDHRHHTRWLNYLFREESYDRMPAAGHQDVDDLASPFCDAWEAMLHAQYFYAAMDVVDLHLSRILAEAYARDTELKIGELKNRLEQNIRKANLLLLQHHDSAKYYKRTVKGELDDILGYWDFEGVLVTAVRDKIRLCQDRLNLLHKESAASSAVYTDLFLLLIGLTSIFGLMLAFTEFGRTMASDADLSTYDAASLGVVEALASQPSDAILALALLISLLIVVLYLFFRQRQTV